MVYFAGIDLAARSSQICIIDDDQQVLINRSVPNDWPRIKQLLKPFRQAGLRIALEASCNWYWIVDRLKAAGYDVTMAHAMQVKAITSAKVKTDKRDAEWLARLLRGGLLPQSHVVPLEQRYLRDLVRWRWRWVNHRAVVQRHMRQISLNEGSWDHTAYFFRTLPPQALEDLDFHPHARLVLGQLIEERDSLDEQMQAVEDVIEAGIANDSRLSSGYCFLRAIPGMGPVNGATVLLESGDITRFHNDRCYVSYCRLTPGVAQSGEKSRRGRMAKAGNAHLKRAFTSIAQAACRFSPAIKAYRDEQRARRRGNGVKVIANHIVAHKICRACYYMLTRNTPWNEEMAFPNQQQRSASPVA